MPPSEETIIDTVDTTIPTTSILDIATNIQAPRYSFGDQVLADRGGISIFRVRARFIRRNEWCYDVEHYTGQIGEAQESELFPVTDDLISKFGHVYASDVETKSSTSIDNS